MSFNNATVTLTGNCDSNGVWNVNVNVYDILDEIDIIDYPQNALRALYFWNIDTLPKNLNYNQFVKMIEDSNLTSNMLISMILNKNNVTDPSFYNSYLVASE